MGLLIGLMRRRQLTIEKSDLSWQLMLITNAIGKADHANQALSRVGTGSDFESDSVIAKNIQQREYKFKVMEEKLKLQKEAIETRLQEIDTELKSVNEMINSGIQEAFSYNAGGRG